MFLGYLDLIWLAKNLLYIPSSNFDSNGILLKMPPSAYTIRVLSLEDGAQAIEGRSAYVFIVLELMPDLKRLCSTGASAWAVTESNF